MTPNFLDRFIGYFSPEVAQRRLAARLRSETISKFNQRGYEGASKGRRTSGWKTTSASAAVEVAASGQILRDRARDLVRNNAYAARAKAVVVNNTVGAGILGKVLTKDEDLQKTLQEKFDRWADTLAIDADGRLNLYGLQAQAIGATFESGEYLIRRRRRRVEDKLPVPVQVQFLEADFLDTSKTGTLKNGNTVYQGIEFDKLGRRAAYWVFPEHPGGSITGKSTSSQASVRIPAEDIIHGFRLDRPGQIRGVTWLAPVMIPLRDLDEYQDATLVGQKIAACFSVFIVEPELPLSGGSSNSDDIRDRIEPAMIEVLPPGRDVKTASPNAPANYSEYVKNTVQRIAAGLGITYESLGDLSAVNFSSGRMGWLEFYRSVEVWRWQMLVPQKLDTLSAWFIEAARLELGIPEETEIRIEWTAPRREMIDPTAEVASTRDAIRAGIKTFSEAVRELGNDPEKHFREYAADLKLIDELKLTFDSDPRKMSKVGFAQTGEALSALAGVEQPAKTNEGKQ